LPLEVQRPGCKVQPATREWPYLILFSAYLKIESGT
jgi:hypothetical protein